MCMRILSVDGNSDVRLCEINFENIIMQRDERFNKDHKVEGQ